MVALDLGVQILDRPPLAALKGIFKLSFFLVEFNLVKVDHHCLSSDK